MTAAKGKKLRGVCLYHSKKWRGTFQHFLNQARDTLITKENLCIFKKVCVCDDKYKDCFPKNWNENISQFSTDCLSDGQKVFFNKLFTSDQWNADKPDLSCVSAKRLVYIMSRVFEADISALLSKNKFGKCSGKGALHFEILVKDFYGRCIGLLIGKKKQNLKPLEHKYGCGIHVGGRAELTGVLLSVRITYPVGQVVKLVEVRNALERRANEIAANQKLYGEKTAIYLKRLKEKRNQQRTQTSKTEIETVKQLNTSTYVRRQTAKRKHFKVESVSKLKGSRCLNCGSVFTEDLFKQHQCKYHLGYVVTKPNSSPVWTCCQAGHSGDNIADHSQLGCTIGHHNWRPNRRGQKSDTKRTINSLLFITE